MAETKTTEAPKEKVKLTIAQVKEDLKAGIDRKQMQDKYGLKRADIIRLFQLPELKGLKVHRERGSKVEPGFVIVPDNEGGTPVTESTATNSTTVNATNEAAQPPVVEEKGW